LTRRALLGASAAATALALPGLAPVGCGNDTEPTGEEVVVIIGGGIAGIHCAYQLKQGGFKATVYEAQKRIGGRMFSDRASFEAEGQLCELGGELIDTGHATMHALAEQLGLQLDDRLTNDAPGFKQETYFIDGAEIPAATIAAQFIKVAPAIAAAFAAAETDVGAYATLDDTSLDQWLIDNVPVAENAELHGVLQYAYRNEYGLETSEQSALNLIYLIDSDEPDPFRIFGDSDERYHTHLGNDSFPTRLAAELDPGQIMLEHKLVAARDAEDGKFTLVFETPDGEETVEVTRIVFALPFTVLREVDLSGLTLSDEKRNIIDTLSYGTNAKVMLGFSTRVWEAEHDASGALVTDLGVQQTWDASIGQDGAHGIITNFLGGQGGLDSGKGEPEDWATQVVPDLEVVWPGMAAAHTGTAVRMHWPTVPTVKGSYTCYTTGQWAFFGLEGAREGNIHFCGEHTSQDYQGYMEGGAETGGFVAAEILEDLETALPLGLVRALGVKLLIPQAGYRARSWAPMNAFQRKRIARQQIARALDLLQSGHVAP